MCVKLQPAMNFLKTIGNSIYSPEFYAVVAKKSFKQSIGYFLLLILLLSLIRITALINPLLITAPGQLQGFVADIVNCFPADFEINITNGQTNINAADPYFVSDCKNPANSQKIAVIDTKTPFSASRFAEYKVLAWITKDSVVFKNNQYETRTYSFAQIKNYKLNKTVLNSYQNAIAPYFKFIGPILLLLSFIGTYLSYDFRLIHLLIIAILILVLGKIFNQNISFRQSYKTGLHAITLGLLVDLLLGLTRAWTGFYGFPFMVTVLTLAVILVNFILPERVS